MLRVSDTRARAAVKYFKEYIAMSTIERILSTSFEHYTYMITCMITVLELTKMIKNYTVLMVSDILLISRQDWRVTKIVFC